MADLLTEFSDSISKNLPGFVAVSILDIYKGIIYHSKSVLPDYNIDLDSNYILEMVRAKLNGIHALKQTQQIQDITITLTSQYHIVDISQNHEFLIYLVVDASEANLTMTKALLNKHKKSISL
ncbi:hypothetical protein [Flavobacterium oreochromis]|uniref:Roadblock/LAMTOR2 domain-containing protein n=2 Tax=Flavobacterium TaxID=237 RepID=A0A2D0AHT9_9FLAO|nr:hypothetical protein [Flavobacterium oreochromis]OWP75775.1 hypothetical protein BWG23_09980 [Flavobacterium oreochromis]OWP77663.1 hypothetical protein BWK62_06810 [Flavobacterium oreochromis]POR22388.1 hypothetical protein BWK58_11105 [Flavobacterium columnare]QYS87637.1 hypothetical protein JJC03_07490 [Flavobacterium oreochromis]